jgi:DNA-binding beta-propeller fold protein YncE
MHAPERRVFKIPGSGKFHPPSITVHSSKANGDARPLRTIQGPNTQLNWPSGIAIDEERGELFVANDIAHSILVFDAASQGNVAPIRVITGPNTNLKHPTGISVDRENGELWVANFGNHSLTVYPTTAKGNAAPLRTIRASPVGSRALMIGNPGAVAYDTKRDEILVPN